ncbi:MAG: hypothetical protein IJT15_04375 [Rickettsiales bacterium]|nr:hypothetical protein [Rickettsiales bacterium]
MQEQGLFPNIPDQGGQGNIFNQFANGGGLQSGNIFNDLAQQQNADITSEEDDMELLSASPIDMVVRTRNRSMDRQDNTIPEAVNDNNNSQPKNDTHNVIESENLDIKNEDLNNTPPKKENNEELNNTHPQRETHTPVNNVVYGPMMPALAKTPNIRDNISEKRKSDNTWQIVLFVIASILLIGALVLAILAALGFFKKKDDIPPAYNEPGNNADNTTNIKDNNVIINSNDDPINNNNNQSVPTIETSDNIDGEYNAGILGDDSYHGSTTISNHDWDGISKSGDLFNDGDITYTDRFKEIVSCENSPNVTYTLWEDLNGDGVCQTNEILAKGKGFMVDGNCAIIDGRKFALTDNMQAYSNLNKLSNQELKVLNHTSTYRRKDGSSHVILNGLKTSVNIDTNHVGGVLNIEGYKIGDFSTTNISKNAFAKDVVESYLNNNNLTEDQKKLISAWNSGRSSDNVKQLMGYQEMDNNQSGKNLTDTHHGKEQNI